MNLRTVLVAPFLAVVGAAAIATLPASACACVEPISKSQLNALKVRGDKGDFDAIGALIAEYEALGDRANRRLWTRRAIQAGAPMALLDVASDWLWRTQKAESLRDKRLYARAALAVLERGYQNRHRIPGKKGQPFSKAAFFAEGLREARAVNAVLADGLAPWVVKARKGDPIAAYHLAKFYFWVELDQPKRSFWETRASVLGDPSLAGQTVNHGRSLQQNLTDIRKALNSPAILARSGDKWMQHRFIENLKGIEAIRR